MRAVRLSYGVPQQEYDVVVVGGGPAGLSAATVLARSRRSVLVIDAGNPRNIRSQGMHGFLSREGMRPAEFLTVVRDQIREYGVEYLSGTVMRVERSERRFAVHTLDEQCFRCRRVLLATGVVDRLPDIPGFQELYGVSIHHCPYCDGWEHRDEPIAVYGNGTSSANSALGMLTWSRDVVLCTDGPARLSGRDKARLKKHGVRIYEQKVHSLERLNGKLTGIVFEDGASVRRTAVFFNTSNEQRSDLPASLGCHINSKGAVETDRNECSTVQGVYVVGDASENAQFVVIAAAEGAKAGMAINKEFQKEEQG